MRFSSCFRTIAKNWNKLGKEEHGAVLHLNVAFVNHSCVPNAILGGLSLGEKDGDQNLCVKLREAKDISKNVEIITCYYEDDVKKYGSILRKRRTAFKKSQGG